MNNENKDIQQDAVKTVVNIVAPEAPVKPEEKPAAEPETVPAPENVQEPAQPEPVQEPPVTPQPQPVSEHEVPKTESSGGNGTVPPESENKKKIPPKKGIIGGIIAAAVVLIALLFSLFSSASINLDKYTTVEFKGYEGYGRATASIDWDKIEDDYGGKIKFSKKAKAKFKELSKAYGNEEYTIDDLADPAELISQCVDVSIDADNNGKLSNGDKVTVEYDVSDELEEVFDVKLKAQPKTVKVKGLEKVQTEDIFKAVTVKFTGADGSGQLEITGGAVDYSSLITADKQNSLSNGDKVTLTVDTDALISQYGKAPKKETKEYTVSGLSKYVSSVSDLSDSAMTALKAQAEDNLRESETEAYGDYKYSSAEYVGAYVLKKKVADDSYSYFDLANNSQLGLVYKVTLTGTRSDAGNGYTYANEGQTETVYKYVAFNDLLIDEEGSLTEEVGNKGSVKAPGYYSDILGLVYGYKTTDEIYTDVVDGNARSWTADWQVNQ